MSTPQSQGRKQHNVNRIPTLETLEKRMLCTVEALESQLQEAMVPVATPQVGSFTRLLEDGFDKIVAPRIARQISANVSRVSLDGTVSLSALGSDSSGERNLSYFWSVLSSPDGSTPRILINGNNAAKSTRLTVNAAGEYRIALTIMNQSGASVTTESRFNVSQRLSSITAYSNTEGAIRTNSTIVLGGNSMTCRIIGLDQFGKEMTFQPTFTVSARSASGRLGASVVSRSDFTNISFPQVDNYRITVTSGRMLTTFNVDVVSRLSRLEVIAPSEDIAVGTSVQLRARGIDQFGREITAGISPSWQVNHGNITSTGLYTAPEASKAIQVTVRSGNLTGTANLRVAGANTSTTIQSEDIASLFTQFYVDGSINRQEMISLLRLPGSDGVVDGIELGDLKYIVANTDTFNIPEHVRHLANDVVNGNPANQLFQGRPLGNLNVGSSSSQLNTLIDKWFLGADVPKLTNVNYAYRTASGNLFHRSPSYLDQKQGAVGDCYLISALGAIAYVNPAAITDMFIDNGDGTFTVRFYGGKYGTYSTPDGKISDGFAAGTTGEADYVTVDRRLPVFSGSRMIYSNYGSDFRNSANVLWIALAEKAYAQWNETGKAGRNGTNTYAGIASGWMGVVNAQITGINSSTYFFNTTPKETLINALNQGQAVTLGTKSGQMAFRLVQGHAYTVVGYNATNDTFTLHNPWGSSHPQPMNYQQLQLYCTAFVTTNLVLQSDSRATVNLNNVSSGRLTEYFALSAQQSHNHMKTISITENRTDTSMPLLKPTMKESSMLSTRANTDSWDFDSEFDLLRQLGHEIQEARDEISMSLYGKEADSDLVAAIDLLFAEETFAQQII